MCAMVQANLNLIAVGYGEFEFGKQRDGMIAFWSLKNPRYPHATIPTLSGVTSLDFATSSPSLLAGASSFILDGFFPFS